MAYIGRGTDKLSNIEKLDTITFDGSSSYTLQKNSVNFTPSSANNLQVSIDGVVQAGNFTVSGSVIDFGVAIPATSTNDFIFHYGTGLITTPADGTVTTAKLADSSVSLAKLTATGTKDATTFLRGDNTFAEAGGGIEEADQFRLTANITSDGNITSNLERNDSTGFSKIGTGMSESSGVFSFPSTGLYLVRFNIHGAAIANDNVLGDILVTTDNSTYNIVARCTFSGDGSAEGNGGNMIETFVNVTNTSTHKVKFDAVSISSGSSIQGDTTQNLTFMTFIKLGDSQ